jgi:hypothetical protein
LQGCPQDLYVINTDVYRKDDLEGVNTVYQPYLEYQFYFNEKGSNSEPLRGKYKIYVEGTTGEITYFSGPGAEWSKGTDRPFASGMKICNL